ncbi:MAG: serine/threonine-protein kinase [Cyanobacteria bacterium P01_F01_bin.153]
MFESGQVVGDRYRLEGQLGSNESRQTWLAKDKESEALVTLKLLALSGLTQWNDVKLLEREAETLKALRHPQLPKFRDYVTLPDQSGWFAPVTDYIPGVSLKEKLQQRHRFGLDELEEIAISILEILHYLHSHHPPILHLDIKPSNLIAGEDNKIYLLIGFGAMQKLPHKAGATFTVDTYGYTPIEQSGGQTCLASDLYALGATLAHLFTGTVPIDLPHDNSRLQLSCSFPNGLLWCWASWLEKLTEPNVSDRPQSAAIALDQLLVMRRSRLRTLERSSAPPRPKRTDGAGSLNHRSQSGIIKVEEQPNCLLITVPSSFKVEKLSPFSLQVWFQSFKRNFYSNSSDGSTVNFWNALEKNNAVILIFISGSVFLINSSFLLMALLVLAILSLSFIILAAAPLSGSGFREGYFESTYLHLYQKRYVLGPLLSNRNTSSGKLDEIKSCEVVHWSPSGSFRDNHRYYAIRIRIEPASSRFLTSSPETRLIGKSLPLEELEATAKQIRQWVHSHSLS